MRKQHDHEDPRWTKLPHRKRGLEVLRHGYGFETRPVRKGCVRLLAAGVPGRDAVEIACATPPKKGRFALRRWSRDSWQQPQPRVQHESAQLVPHTDIWESALNTACENLRSGNKNSPFSR